MSEVGARPIIGKKRSRFTEESYFEGATSTTTMALSIRACVLLAVLALVLMDLVTAAPAPAPTPSPIWRLFGGFGGGFGGGYGQRGSRAYNGPPPEGPNEYKSICRVNNADNYAFGPGHIPAGPVCPW